MAKAYTLASWNVEHFKDDPARVKRIVAFLSAQKPDVFALLEVEGKTVYDALVLQMPKYQFHITEGPQTQEILIGVRNTFTAFFTQRVEFKSGNGFLRPGALLTLHKDNVDYPILFLHLKSATAPVGLGIRDNQFEHVANLKKALDKKAPAGRRANLVVVGDLNTMGMEYPFGRAIDAATELQKLDRTLKRKSVAMRRLDKNATATWFNGSNSSIPPSDLDHVLAAEHLSFKSFQGAQVSVRGWVDEETDQTKDRWIKDFSDHALLYAEVQRP